MTFFEAFVVYSLMLMALGIPATLLYLYVGIHRATRDIGEDWSKKRPVTGATASPDAGAQPAG